MKLQTLYLATTRNDNLEDNSETRNAVKQSFWERQFRVETTGKQKVFDWFFGIILPAVCFLFDPIVFRTNDAGSPLGGEYKPFAYLLSFASILGLTAFLLWGAKLKWMNGFLSGLFAVGALVSFVIGFMIFPFSVMGLIIFIGILGFTPLFTAIVYWRNAVRSYKTVLPAAGFNLSVRMMILAAMFALILPMLINVKIQKGLNTMQYGTPSEISRTAQRLKYVAPLIDFSSLHAIRDAQGNVVENEENKALSESYKMLTGGEISQYQFFD